MPRDLLVRTRHAVDPIRFDLEDGPWPGTDDRGTCVALFDRRSRRAGAVPFEVEVHRALRRAVWLARPPGLHDRGELSLRLAAYAAWIDALIRPGQAPGADETPARLRVRYGLSCRTTRMSEMIGIRHVLHRTLTELSRATRSRRVRSHAERALRNRRGRGPARPGSRRALRGTRRSGRPLWKGTSSIPPGGTRRQGLDARLRREETARCLRIAAEAHARAVDAIERHVPPTEQELAGSGGGGEAREEAD